MKVDLLNESTMEAMGSYLSRLSRRQQVVASNIANIDTPGYRSTDVSFHATISELLAENTLPLRRRTRGETITRGISFPSAEPFEVEGLPERADRNNVDIDREMLKLSETAFGYGLMIQLLRGKFRTISSSIQEGRPAS